MIIVHHLENSRSQRVLWLLEELGQPYEVKRYERNRQTMLAPPELKRLHPLGKSPLLEDDGVIYAETGAIFEHLLAGHDDGRLVPSGPADARKLTYWLHYAEGSAMPPLLLKLVFDLMPQRSPGLMRPLVRGIAGRAKTGFVEPQLTLHMDFWEAELAATGWFAGPAFSAADVMMSFPVEAAAARAGLRDGRPRASAWLERVHARPAYAHALERGGPYAYA